MPLPSAFLIEYFSAMNVIVTMSKYPPTVIDIFLCTLRLISINYRLINVWLCNPKTRFKSFDLKETIFGRRHNHLASFMQFHNGMRN